MKPSERVQQIADSKSITLSQALLEFLDELDDDAQRTVEPSEDSVDTPRMGARISLLPHERLIVFRGSKTDLATDVCAELTRAEAQMFLEEVERFLAHEPQKFKGG